MDDLKMAAAQLALGRILRLGSRRPNYVRDRNRGAAGD